MKLTPLGTDCSVFVFRIVVIDCLDCVCMKNYVPRLYFYQ